MTRLVLALVLACIVLAGCATADEALVPAGDAALEEAFEQRAHDRLVEGAGVVTRVLKDDAEGDRHQRFIVRLGTGQTVLVAHNIDVAPRIEDLRVGDAVEFRGVYEWSEEGGTVHWTHHDSDGPHAPGWLRHEGRTYQ